MSKYENLTGQRFGRFVAENYDFTDKHGFAHWSCRCDCGIIKTISGNSLKMGTTKSCGCIRDEDSPFLEDLTGKVFKYITVKERHPIRTKFGGIRWICICKCGKEKIISAQSLKRGTTKSCGCLKRKILINKLFGYLLVEKEILIAGRRMKHFECKCKCGNIIIVSYGNLVSGNTKSCGCFRKKKMSRRKGSKNPCWNPNMTDAERNTDKTLRRNKKSKKWCSKVYKRDNYTCQCCKQRGGKLVAHHIYSWKTHKHLRHTVSNGITFCEPCHIMFHRLFGYKNSTRKKLSTFLRKTKFISI